MSNKNNTSVQHGCIKLINRDSNVMVMVILNCNNILLHFFDQRNTAYVSIRDLFQKHNNLTDLTPLNSMLISTIHA